MANLHIHLRELRQIFNAIDPAPVRERDLDPTAEEFIVSWATELPPSEPLQLIIDVDSKPDDRSRSVVGEAVNEFFRGRATATRRKLRHLMQQGRTSLLIALGFMALVMTAASLLDDAARSSPLLLVLRESLVVGGWVAMWRPMEIFLYAWWPILAEARRFDRLAGMPVEVRVRG